MPKAVRISIPITSSKESETKSDSGEFVSVVMSSGIGLLISLILILSGVQAVWS